MATAQQHRQTLLQGLGVSSPASPRRAAQQTAASLQREAVASGDEDGSAAAATDAGGAEGLPQTEADSTPGPAAAASAGPPGAVQLPACFGLLQPTGASVEAGKARLDLHRSVHQKASLPYPVTSQLTSSHVQLGTVWRRMAAARVVMTMCRADPFLWPFVCSA